MKNDCIDFETQVSNANQGDSIVYFVGKTPRHRSKLFRTAMMLFEFNTVNLVQKLISRDHNDVGVYEYIAQRK